MATTICLRDCFALFIVFFNVLLSGCSTQTAPMPLAPFDSSKYRSIQIDTCVDRSGYSGSRNIVEEATLALKEKIKNADLFQIQSKADLIMTCDIQKYSEGSVFKRSLRSIWGVTRAEISIMIWEKAASDIIAKFESQTEVGQGGLLTLGADSYVIDVAINDIIRQLKKWTENIR